MPELLMRLVRNKQLLAGTLITTLVLLVALVGPFLTQHDPNEPIGVPFGPPSPETLLGTDVLGRDVLSRVLAGGRSIIICTAIAAFLAYAIALPIAGLSALSESRYVKVWLRSLDILLAFPPILLILILVGAFGVSLKVVVIATALSQVPSIARMQYAASVDVALSPYVTSARLRGESRFWLLTRELVPNISGSLSADFGVRTTLILLLITAANFLGVGVQPPTADWGAMLAENQAGMMLNSWALLVPSALIASLTIGVSFLVSGYSERTSAGMRATQEIGAL